MVYIGIDLGTTYSCIAIVENGKPIIIYNEEGKDFTPSIVSYGDNEILVGNHALNYPDLSRVLYDSKKLLGWEFMYRLPIAEDRLLWTFDLDARNSSVGYVLNRGTEKERFILPEEVSAHILRQLKSIAKECIGKPVTEAVVAIPAFFQAAQIEATKKAVQMAGLELKMLINEPIAAAIAYNEDKKLQDSNIMIFDFGGGTLDVNICEIKNGKLAIKAVNGNEHLGGQDFDGIIMNYVLQEYKKKSTYDILGNKRLVKRLRAECRRAKEALSSDDSSHNIHLDIGTDRHLDLNVSLTKIKFNELCEKLYAKTSNLIDYTLKMANLRTEDIDHVIMVGGSTRIPAIKSILKMKFGQRKLKFNINPDEAVVFGAAILADAIEKKKRIPLINNTMNKLPWDSNDLQFSGDNSFNNLDKNLFYFLYQNGDKDEGRIGLFNSFTHSVEEIAKFRNWYASYEVATIQNKIFGIDGKNESFEIYDLNTRQISRGPDPPEWRKWASVAYFKGKLYYLGGLKPRTYQHTERVDVLIDGKWQTKPTSPLPVTSAQAITCDEILYVIGGWNSHKIYRLSDDEQEWIKIGEIPEKRDFYRVASLNGRIYITGGRGEKNAILKSCLCFDPSAPVDSRISQIADMKYVRNNHSIVVADGKLYAIGGYQEYSMKKFCDSIEEYDPRTNEWMEVGEFMEPIEPDIEKSQKLNKLCPQIKKINPRESSESEIVIGYTEFASKLEQSVKDKSDKIWNQENANLDEKLNEIERLIDGLNNLNIKQKYFSWRRAINKSRNSDIHLAKTVSTTANQAPFPHCFKGLNESTKELIYNIWISPNFPDLDTRFKEIDHVMLEKSEDAQKKDPQSELAANQGAKNAFAFWKMGTSWLGIEETNHDELKTSAFEERNLVEVIKDAYGCPFDFDNMVLFPDLASQSLRFFDTKKRFVWGMGILSLDKLFHSISIVNDDINELRPGQTKNKRKRFTTICCLSNKRKRFFCITNGPHYGSNGSIHSNVQLLRWRKNAFLGHFNYEYYYFGGDNSKKVEIFNYQTNRHFVDLPISISNGKSAACNDKLYVIDVSNTGNIYKFSDEYDNWICSGNIGNSRAECAVAVFNNKIYFVGGIDNKGQHMASCVRFDPILSQQDAVSSINPLMMQRAYHSLIVANGKIYAVGGIVDRNSHDRIPHTDLVEEYDPELDSWTSISRD